MNILLLDNYDSFTYNIVELLRRLEGQFTIRKNDEIVLSELPNYSHIIISPGPSLPKDAGITVSLLNQAYRTHKILGICLGHQAIAEAFGGKLKQLPLPRHGMPCEVMPCKPSSILFNGIPEKFIAGLYHSWTVSEDHFPDVLRITARSSNGDILAIEHHQYPVFGIQFHPESYMSEYGLELIRNFYLAT